MTTVNLQAKPFVEMVAPKLQIAYVRCLRALDDFAEARMRNAVPERQVAESRSRDQSLSPADTRRPQITAEAERGRSLTFAFTPTGRGGMARGARWIRSQSVVDQTTSAPLVPIMPSHMRPLVHAAGMHMARAAAKGRVLLSRLRDSMAETRRQREILETELFRGRYHLSSKNDDDLPIVR